MTKRMSSLGVGVTWRRQSSPMACEKSKLSRLMGQMERSASAMPMMSHPPEEFENDAMILGTLRRTVVPNVCLNSST